MIGQRSAYRRLVLGRLAGIGMFGMLCTGVIAALVPTDVRAFSVIGFIVCAAGTLTLAILSFTSADR